MCKKCRHHSYQLLLSDNAIVTGWHQHLLSLLIWAGPGNIRYFNFERSLLLIEIQKTYRHAWTWFRYIHHGRVKLFVLNVCICYYTSSQGKTAKCQQKRLHVFPVVGSIVFKMAFPNFRGTSVSQLMFRPVYSVTAAGLFSKILHSFKLCVIYNPVSSLILVTWYGLPFNNAIKPFCL